MACLIRKAHCTCKTDCQAPNSCFLLRKDVIVSHQYNKYKEKYEEKMQVERMKAWRKSSFCWLFHSNLLLPTRSKKICNHTDISRPTSYKPCGFPPTPSKCQRNHKFLFVEFSWQALFVYDARDSVLMFYKKNTFKNSRIKRWQERFFLFNLKAWNYIWE